MKWLLELKLIQNSRSISLLTKWGEGVVAGMRIVHVLTNEGTDYHGKWENGTGNQGAKHIRCDQELGQAKQAVLHSYLSGPENHWPQSQFILLRKCMKNSAGDNWTSALTWKQGPQENHVRMSESLNFPMAPDPSLQSPWLTSLVPYT